MFVAASMFVVAGCSKDNEGSSVNKNDLVGSWNMTKMHVVETVSGLTDEYAAYNGTQEREMSPGEGESTVFIFGSDGTYTIKNVSPNNTLERTGTWSLSGKTLTVSLPEDGEMHSETMEVDKVTSSNLILSKHITETRELVPGQVASIVDDATFYFDKM